MVAQNTKLASAPAATRLLRVEPVKGYVGDSFTISGEGLPAGKRVEFFWATVEAAYVTKVMEDNVEYHERKYTEKRVHLGGAPVNAHGRISAAFTAPEDFGEVQDPYAVVDGQDVAPGGFRILRRPTQPPTTGPSGS